MNILFLSLSSEIELEDGTIYGSILNELVKKKYNLYVVSPIEKRNKKKTFLIEKNNYKLLKVRTGNIQKTNIIEKGISTILIESQFKQAIKKHFKGIKFDLILYSTPPITFCNTIKYFKKRDNAKTYLMLKDIFPQNAVDLKYFSQKSLFYKYFRKKEIALYKLSDTIGCMSQKNKEYLIEHNNYLNEDKIELFPNSINPKTENIRNLKLNEKYRKQYDIPISSKVFMYGGNLGKPQGITFIIECLEKVKDLKNTFFVICGSGTEYKNLEEYVNNNKISNLLLLNGLPKKEYSELLNIADVGLIFLDYNFTIPNFPSRLLSYMEKGIPVLSCTDMNTDISDIVENNGFGFKCYSNNSNGFKDLIKIITKLDNNELNKMGENGLKYLNNNYRSDINVDNIIEKTVKRKKIVQINSVNNGSTGNIMINIHKELSKQGYDSYIFYGRNNKKNFIKDEHNVYFGSKINTYFHALCSRLTDMEGFFSILTTKKMLKKIDTIKPDIIHLHNIHGHYINVKLLFKYIKSNNIKVVWTLHDCWTFTGHCSYFGIINCLKWKNQCYSCPLRSSYPKSLIDNSRKNYIIKKELFTNVKDLTIVTPSDWLANLVKESFFRNYKIKVINNGIDTNYFKIMKTNELTFRKKYRIVNKKIILGVASIWVSNKGLVDFINLSKIIDDRYVIVLVGLNDKQLKQLPSNIIGIKRTESIEQLVEIYNSSDVFVNPTYEDNYPTVNLEAVACGLPIITYDTGGSYESTLNCGIVTKEKNAKSIYEVLKEEKFDKVNIKFDKTIKNMVDNYISIYNDK